MKTCLKAYNNKTILIMSNPKHVLLELKCPLCLNRFVESERFLISLFLAVPTTEIILHLSFLSNEAIEISLGGGKKVNVFL